MTTRARSTGGFTLIEILISVVMLSILAAGLAGGMLSSSRLSRGAKLSATRNAIMNSEVSRLSALPMGDLPAGTTTANVVRDGVTFTRTTVIASWTDSLRARVIVAAPVGRGIAPDTVTFTRTRRAGNGNPFAP
jgi:prepilin-type N-terminal cleavage/methylation domain-containing protein